MSEEEEGGGRIVGTVIKAVIVGIVALPAFIGSVAAGEMAADPRLWAARDQINKWKNLIWVSAAVAVVLWLLGGWAMLWSLDRGFLACWVLWTVLTAPMALWAIEWRLGEMAEAVEDGTLNPRYAVGVKHAMGEGALKQAKNARATTGAVCPDGEAGGAIIGRYVASDHRHKVAKKARPRVDILTDWVTERGEIAVPRKLTPPHLAVMGRSGTGKTEVMLRYAQMLAVDTGAKICFIDGKGSIEDQIRFNEVMESLSYKVCNWPQQSFDLWRGTGREIKDRLISCLEWSDPYYKSQAQAAFALIVAKSPFGPPRTAEQFKERLLNPTAWVGRDRLHELGPMMDGRNATWPGIQSRYQAWLDDIEDGASGGPGSFSFEDADAVYIRLDMAVAPESMRTLAGAMLRDFEAYSPLLGERRGKDERPWLMICDEFSAYNSAAPSVVQFMERGRSAKVRVLLGAQSWEGMSEDAARIVNAGVSYWILANDDPEEVCRRAGTRQRLETGHSDSSMSYRLQDTFVVDPQEVRKLGVGEMIVSSKGRAVKCAINLPLTAEEIKPLKKPGAVTKQTTQSKAERLALTDKAEINNKIVIEELPEISRRKNDLFEPPKNTQADFKQAADVLGVHQDADGETIRKAYVEAAKRTHPDKGGNKAAFELTQIAFEVFKDAGRVESTQQERKKAAPKTDELPF